MENCQGKLLVLEGIDGSGKSTQIKLLSETLNKDTDCKIICSSEPTNRKYGKILRKTLKGKRLKPQEELDLFIMDRKDHVENFIQPKLAQGYLVILDRYYYSNIAYQGTRGFDINEIRLENEKFTVKPNLVIFLDIDPRKALERILLRKYSANEFEKLEDLYRTRDIFLDMKDDNFVILNANVDSEVLHKNILEIVNKYILHLSLSI